MFSPRRRRTDWESLSPLPPCTSTPLSVWSVGFGHFCLYSVPSIYFWPYLRKKRNQSLPFPFLGKWNHHFFFTEFFFAFSSLKQTSPASGKGKNVTDTLLFLLSFFLFEKPARFKQYNYAKLVRKLVVSLCRVRNQIFFNNFTGDHACCSFLTQ